MMMRHVSKQLVRDNAAQAIRVWRKCRIHDPIYYGLIADRFADLKFKNVFNNSFQTTNAQWWIIKEVRSRQFAARTEAVRTIVYKISAGILVKRIADAIRDFF